MKFLLMLPLMVMIIVFNVGCSMLVDNNETKQTSVVESQDKKNEMVKVDNHLIAAKQALSAGDYVKTIEEATASIKDNPNSSEAYSVRGFATALHGDTAKGLADTKKAYDLDPNNVANFYNMAMVYKLQGQLNDSKQWFEKVLEKDPSNTWSVYGIATIYADQGDDTKALDWLEKAINIDPSVKAVAAEQDHFERFHNNKRFKTLVGL
ncbi:tetratricopeptide repeat protein [uncultured Veillonella sp.]|uniref:tetratricopeptide repeat protein n=1 Tax=uncultured Veillonella sp. TaxID=159268 RepID=UPI002616FF00|nr:tetratricopeptide repeat protein [uncultured Veillonella sp.]